jgi:uncharacterized protein YciI
MLSEGPTAEEEAILAEHFNYLKALAEQGVVQLAGRTQTTDESSFGIIIFRAETEAAARKIMNDDPAVREGVMLARFFPYRIAIVGEGLGA